MRKMLKREHITFVDYLVVFLMIVCCGFPAGEIIPAKTYTIIFVGVSYICLNKTKLHPVYKSLAIMVAAFFAIVWIHHKRFAVYESGLLHCITLSISGYFVFLIVGNKFRLVYLNIFTFLAAISLAFYFLMIVFHYVPSIDFIYTKYPSFMGVFLWNVRINEILLARNCGPFWEPGAFAGYLLMVFVFYFNDLKDLWENHKKKVIIILITIITTLSTQGYLIAFLLLLCKMIVTTKGGKYGKMSMMTFVILIISFILYESLPFLKEKIDKQLELTEQWDSKTSLLSANRFTTTMLDYSIIMEYPLFGASSSPEIKYRDFEIIQQIIEERDHYGTGSGMTGFAASNGLLLLFVWIYLTYLAFVSYYHNRKTAILILISILALGQCETYIGGILYLSLPYLSITSVGNNKKDTNKKIG